MAAALLAAGAFAGLVPGNRLPPLSVEGLNGPIPDVSGRVAVLDFWASWCAPCKASFPAYSRLQSEFGGDGLVIIGVGVDESPAAYRAFLAKLKPSFATLHDSAHMLVGSVQIGTMPTCYVVDRKGIVRFVHAGFHGDQTERELRGELQALLAEKAP